MQYEVINTKLIQYVKKQDIKAIDNYFFNNRCEYKYIQWAMQEAFKVQNLEIVNILMNHGAKPIPRYMVYIDHCNKDMFERFIKLKALK